MNRNDPALINNPYPSIGSGVMSSPSGGLMEK